MTIEHVSTVAAPRDVVARTIIGEAYNIENQTSREDVIEARYEVVEGGDDRLRFDVHVVSYARNKTGGIDRSRQERSRTEYRWDGATHTLRWTHVGEHGDRVDVGGVTRLVDEGERTRVERTVHIDIRIPVIGRGIARIVEREFRKGLDNTAAVLDRMARAQA